MVQVYGYGEICCRCCSTVRPPQVALSTPVFGHGGLATYLLQVSQVRKCPDMQPLAVERGRVQSEDKEG